MSSLLAFLETNQGDIPFTHYNNCFIVYFKNDDIQIDIKINNNNLFEVGTNSPIPGLRAISNNNPNYLEYTLDIESLKNYLISLV